MGERPGLIPSHYFEPRPGLVLGAGEVVVICYMRNELERLPFFLDYYRGLGVDRFLLIDNNSTDGTGEFLRDQPDDVEYFFTESSFLGSDAGRLWVQEIAETYARDHWVLNVDVDELFVYPGVERFGIKDLCDYLDSRQYEGVFAPMLDMYSDLPLSRTVYRRGTDFRETCPYFEIDSYTLSPAAFPPFLGIRGGPRGRFIEGTNQTAPVLQQRKIPLVKWRAGFSYIACAHSSRFVPLADITGVLLHYKFFATWVEAVARDHVRGDRLRSMYAFYSDHVKGELCFHGPQSHRYRDSRDLLRLGVMASTDPLRRFYAARLRERDETAEYDVDPVLDELLPEPVPTEVGLTLGSVATLWPFACNQRITRVLRRGAPSPEERTEEIRELAADVEVVDVWADRILVRLRRKALHDLRSGGLELVAYVGDEQVGRTRMDSTASGLEVDVDALLHVFRWRLDVAGAAGKDPSPVVRVCLGDASAGAAEVSVLERSWSRSPAGVAGDARFQGVVERYEDGELRGWVYDAESLTFDVPIAVYFDGRLVCYERPTVRRNPLAQRLGCPPGVIGRGFRFTVPRGFLRDSGVASTRMDVRIPGTNLSLRRAPLDFPTAAETLVWTEGAGWSEAPPVADRS